eukprot:COSAG06_NODE_12392_length_1388_cov_1.143522_2_plen_269_part_00
MRIVTLLLVLVLLAAATSPSPDAAISFEIGWDEPPLAVTPIVNSWHDTAQGSAGNPAHDSVYPPTEYDIVDALNARRRELRSPYARLFSETNLVYDWPNSTRTTVVGPSALPPNTSDTCRYLFSKCTCCPRADCPCVAGQIAKTTSWDFSALDIQVAALQNNTAFPHTNIMQFTGNVEPWWWFKGCSPTACPCGGGFADPSGVTVAMWHSRVLDWYTKGVSHSSTRALQPEFHSCTDPTDCCCDRASPMSSGSTTTLVTTFHLVTSSL